MSEISFGGPLAGAVVVMLGLVLLFAPARTLYRGNRVVVRRPLREPEPPLWARLFFRILGVILLALGVALLRPLF